jgi:hypothetical protein
VDQVALGQHSSRASQFPVLILIPPTFQTHSLVHSDVRVRPDQTARLHVGDPASNGSQ